MGINNVVLVDENNVELGIMEKLEAHKKGLLHRAISVFTFNSKGEMLLQQRAKGKYHSELLWTNTCCSHPFPKETDVDAANRRLQEEMGLSAELKYSFSFQYKVKFDNGLTENELDQVFIGMTNDEPIPNPDEVNAYEYRNIDLIKNQIDSNPEEFTEWFKLLFPKVLEVS